MEFLFQFEISVNLIEKKPCVYRNTFKSYTKTPKKKYFSPLETYFSKVKFQLFCYSLNIILTLINNENG